MRRPEWSTAADNSSALVVGWRTGAAAQRGCGTHSRAWRYCGPFGNCPQWLRVKEESICASTKHRADLYRWLYIYDLIKMQRRSYIMHQLAFPSCHTSIQPHVAPIREIILPDPHYRHQETKDSTVRKTFTAPSSYPIQAKFQPQRGESKKCTITEGKEASGTKSKRV